MNTFQLLLEALMQQVLYDSLSYQNQMLETEFESY